MSIKIKLLVGLLTFLVLQLGCVKLPDQVNSPNIRINYSNAEGKDVYTLIFSCMLQNDNPNTALIDLSANVKASMGNGAIVEIFPIKTAAILPFNTEIVESVQKRTKDQILNLIKALNIDESELIETGSVSGIFLKPSDVHLSNIKCSHVNIKDYLKGKLNEKDN